MGKRRARHLKRLAADKTTKAEAKKQKAAEDARGIAFWTKGKAKDLAITPHRGQSSDGVGTSDLTAKGTSDLTAKACRPHGSKDKGGTRKRRGVHETKPGDVMTTKRAATKRSFLQQDPLRDWNKKTRDPARSHVNKLRDHMLLVKQQTQKLLSQMDNTDGNAMENLCALLTNEAKNTAFNEEADSACSVLHVNDQHAAAVESLEQDLQHAQKTIDTLNQELQKKDKEIASCKQNSVKPRYLLVRVIPCVYIILQASLSHQQPR